MIYTYTKHMLIILILLLVFQKYFYPSDLRDRIRQVFEIEDE